MTEAIALAAGPTMRRAGGISGRMVALLALAMFINYADRGSLSVVAPVLKDRLAIGDAGMGVLLSSFFWSYTLCQPLAGSLVQRLQVRWVLAGALALWAGATFLCGLAGSFGVLLALRLVMGVGESVIYPANGRILAEQAEEGVRGRCNGLIAMAMCLGPTGGTLAGGLILAHFGWRSVFLALGVASLSWLVPWLAMSGPSPSTPQTGGRMPGPGYGQLLRSRAVWGASLGQFCYSWQFYLLLTWLPAFLVKSEHLPLTAMAIVGAAVYGLQAIAALLSGVITDRLVRAGHPPSVRRTAVMLGVAGGGAALLATGFGPHAVKIPCLLAAGVCTGLANPLMFSLGQTLAGPDAGGRWMGVQNMTGNFAGILAPLVTGVVVAASQSFAGAFAVAAALSIAGVVLWGPVLGAIEPVAWRTSGAAVAG